MASMVSVYSFDQATGAFQGLQTISSLPKGFAKPNDAAEIEIDPAGKFLYASNRGDDSIAVFSINPNTGTLTPVEYASTKGQSPRNFEIAPGGSLLVVGNEKSDNIVTFHIDRKSGRLTPTGKLLELAQPVCVRFVPVK
jgi:6-phosphogluconolactonase